MNVHDRTGTTVTRSKRPDGKNTVRCRCRPLLPRDTVRHTSECVEVLFSQCTWWESQRQLGCRVCLLTLNVEQYSTEVLSPSCSTNLSYLFQQIGSKYSSSLRRISFTVDLGSVLLTNLTRFVCPWVVGPCTLPYILSGLLCLLTSGILNLNRSHRS